MNIKTTVVLLVLLIGVGGYLLFTREKDAGESKPVVHSLVDVKTSDITRFAITDSDGKTIEVQKSNDSAGLPVWKLTKPVNATADNYKVNSLLDSITGVKSTSEIDPQGSTSTGLDKPQYTVDLFSGSSDTKVLVGNSLSVSDGVYVKVGDKAKVDVVPTSLTDALAKPANDLRKTQLFETASPAVQQFTVTRKDGSEVALQKVAQGWEIVRPELMPGDSTAISDLISSVINMTPVEFVDEPSLAMGFNHPTATVTFSAAAPTTQPTTQPMSKIVFGGYDDVEKKNVFVQTPDGTIVKVAASILDTLNKKPLELRDKTVVDVDPATISGVQIAVTTAATTQPVAPATEKVTLLGKRHKDNKIGPALPTTTTAPATQPTSDWYVAGPKPIDADDAKITALLGQVHPLKADKFDEKPSASKAVKTYTLTLTPSGGPPMVITLSDPGNDGSLMGTYNGLTFEMPRSIATDLGADFVKSGTVR